jgi:hypothetical protein
MDQAMNLQRQRDEFLKKNVIGTDPAGDLIQWSMWSAVPGDSGSLGHGVHYHDTARSDENDIVAFIRGFAWRHNGFRRTVQGYYIPPDAITTQEIMTSLKQRIEALVAAREIHYYPQTWITDRIYARGNC